MKRLDVSSAALHVLGMAFMVCDHIWGLFGGPVWMPCIGRLAFPIFAFLAVEGYFHTGNLRRYISRLLIFAAVSEIPFNFMYSGVAFYPVHQNTLWTLLIGLGFIAMIERVKSAGKRWKTVLVVVGAVVLGFVAGMATMVDYYGAGVLTVLVFYLFRGRKWWCFLGQLVCLCYLNVEVLGGLYYPVTVLGRYFELHQQSLALLALIPIWLYRGRQGYHSKRFQYFCYAFYPVHILAITLVFRAVV